MLMGTLIVAVASVAFAARVSTPARHFFNIYHYYRLATGLCVACCPWP